MKTLIRLLLPAVVFALPVFADNPAILQKARDYLGGDAALEAVNSVRYKGQLTSSVVDGDGETAENTAAIEIIFAEPFYQRIAINSPGKSETTALDDYEAWQKVANPEDSSQWRMTLLDTAQIRRLRANTWENLAFFGDLEAHGGTVTDHGVVNFEGERLHKVSFDHGYGIVFHRYFNPANGRLVVSETDNGARIRENGENRVAGVRFPGEVVTVSPRSDGGTTTVRVVFDEVTVNEPLARSLFRVPSVTSQ